MKPILNSILLIDDSESDNFFHQRVINQIGCTNHIVAVESGQAALDYLTSKVGGEHPQPDLIFLDINMPGMNGWEFIEEYDKLDPKYKGNVIVVMLTTSLNPDDKHRAEDIENIKTFMSKPLTKEMANNLLLKHFKDRL
ncbi:response regulator [Roseivirga sp. UBA1976]|mgnify:CR=1 FL=1|uniref:response regulator n=1 Tax=Roseivirga sp. UBA1976 TaxID=1947386 RepID=UPI00257C6836|nr:response regulator [Roseivirga sp. UBA1976]MEC7754241.1 response regulator [Bacteroidota bacterium]|tara:strand:+ start:1397 stop:1813 length:417 start_codon:yes stop_codon:yes gene_type:complete